MVGEMVAIETDVAKGSLPNGRITARAVVEERGLGSNILCAPEAGG